jgi:hypothetical protein
MTESTKTIRDEIIERSAEFNAEVEKLKAANAAAKKPARSRKAAPKLAPEPGKEPTSPFQPDWTEADNTWKHPIRSSNPEITTEKPAASKTKRTSTKKNPAPENPAKGTLPEVVAEARNLMKSNGNKQPDFLKAATVKLSDEELVAVVAELTKRFEISNAQWLCDILTWGQHVNGKRVATSVARVQKALEALNQPVAK